MKYCRSYRRNGHGRQTGRAAVAVVSERDATHRYGRPVCADSGSEIDVIWGRIFDFRAAAHGARANRFAFGERFACAISDRTRRAKGKDFDPIESESIGGAF